MHKILFGATVALHKILFEATPTAGWSIGTVLLQGPDGVLLGSLLTSTLKLNKQFEFNENVFFVLKKTMCQYFGALKVRTVLSASLEDMEETAEFLIS